LRRGFLAVTSLVAVDAGSALGGSGALTTDVGGSSAGVSMRSGSASTVASVTCCGLDVRTTGSVECEACNDCLLAIRCGASAGCQVKASSAAPPTIAPTAVLTIRDATPKRGLGASLIQPVGVRSYRARALLQAISPRARAVRTRATFSIAVPGKSQTSRPLPRCLSMASILGPSSCLFIDATRTHATR
jgi:hypothetical protein